MANPLVQGAEDPRSFCSAKVYFPAGQVAPKFFHHVRNAATASARGGRSHAVFHRAKGFVGHASLDHTARARPKAVPQESAREDRRDRALGLVDTQPEFAIQTP